MVLGIRIVEHVAHVKDADDIVDIFGINRKSRIICFLHNEIERFLQSHLPVECDDRGPVCHDIRRHLIVKLKDVRDHLRLAGLQNALFMAFIDHVHDIFLSHVVILLADIDPNRL